MNQRSLRVSLIGVLAVIACDRGSATIARTSRDTVMIDGTAPACTACTLTVDDSIRLGTHDDKLIPLRVPEMVRDSRGHVYLIFNDWGDQPILHYDDTGRFIGRVGASGRGPGEYDMTSGAVIGSGDSVFVVEWGGLAVQVFSADGKFARRMLFPARVRPFAIAPDSAGVSVMYATRAVSWRDTTTSHVLRLTPDGTVRDSFPIFTVARIDSIDVPGRGRQPVVSRHESRPALGPRGTVWSYAPATYRLERHAASGAETQLIGVTLPGLAPPVMTAAQFDSIYQALRSGGKQVLDTAGRRARPFGLSLELIVDSTGLLWVSRIIRAPGADTIKVEKLHLSPHEAPGETTIPQETVDRLSHTIIEVIDPVRMELLARHQLPFRGSLIAPGFVSRVTTDDEGYYAPSVYRLTFVRR